MAKLSVELVILQQFNFFHDFPSTMAYRPYTFDRVVRILFSVLLLIALLWFINVLKGVLLPFCVAVLIAYLMEPFVQFNRRLLHLRGRIVAIFVTLFEALFFFGVLCYFLIPAVLNELNQMAAVFSNFASEKISFTALPDNIQDLIRRHIDFRRLSQMITSDQITALVEKTLSGAWSIITSSVEVVIGILGWCIVALYVVFIMIDYDRLGRGFRHMVPPKYRKEVFRIGRDIKDSMNHYFRGQALVASCVGVLFAIGFAIVGLPMAVVLGLFIGLLNMVPYLQLVSIVPTVILCLVSSAGGETLFWPLFWKCMAVYCIVQVIQDLFLTPRIMGKAMGLNPAIILLSLSVWGTLLGMIGLIIALPLTTLLLSYYDQYIIRRDHDEGDDDDIDADLNAIDEVSFVNRGGPESGKK